LLQPIVKEDIQKILDSLKNKDLYIHLETTNGAYAAHKNENKLSAGAYIRNAKIRFSKGGIMGEGPSYRVGLKMDLGWIYAEGLTDWEVDEAGRLLLAGHNAEGRLAAALQLSENPF
jgi:hypothetical protein